MKQQRWLITGCSSGLGRALARHVLLQGHNVVVTARDIGSVRDIVMDYPSNALAMTLDVTDVLQVSSVVKQVEMGVGPIDVLVNNAGYGYMAAIEEGEDSAVRAQFETNVFGVVNMIKAVLPGMRQRQRGHIVNMSCIGGLVAFAGTGYYHATKFALEGLSESLSQEVLPLGIKVLIVEPGPFRTAWAGRSMVESRIRIDDYNQATGLLRTLTRKHNGKQPGDPERAALLIFDTVQSANPPLRLLLGRGALSVAYQKLDILRADFDNWRASALEADYPEFHNPLAE